MARGWPSADDLAARLGLSPGDDDAQVLVAYEAARADALYYGVPVNSVDPELGAADDAVFLAILDLGVNWYQSRNRPSDFATQGPYAVNVPSRYRAIAVIQRGTVSIA
jgi:hypothetical protein